jgi:hypothetical protein
VVEVAPTITLPFAASPVSLALALASQTFDIAASLASTAVTAATASAYIESNVHRLVDRNAGE